MRDDFCTNLSENKEVRAGVNGEWGKEEHLTIEGLLSLCDGEWVSRDVIDAYLNIYAKEMVLVSYTLYKLSPILILKNFRNLPVMAVELLTDGRIQYIPTFALVSYKKTKLGVYWKMEGVETFLAPVHLNDNHWAMAVARMQKREIIVMDSLNNGVGHSYEGCRQDGTDIDIKEEWTLRELLNVPKQSNGTDCGIFAFMYAIILLKEEIWTLVKLFFVFE
ncbi:unnamed protein product [Meloidogyne enterolobii]|uniref:Uncharacterized protein n=1 Tax=Meloidogyne enterolobii TaxID=390850 RepID=A0ACB0XPV0_MELEN